MRLTRGGGGRQLFGVRNRNGISWSNAACAPLPLRGIANGAGTSSFGNFTYSHTACTTGATGPVTGTYIIDSDIDQFSGVFSGTSATTATPGLFDLIFPYTINGGTGRFLGGTGAFSQVGTADVATSLRPD